LDPEVGGQVAPCVELIGRGRRGRGRSFHGGRDRRGITAQPAAVRGSGKLGERATGAAHQRTLRGGRSLGTRCRVARLRGRTPSPDAAPPLVSLKSLSK